MRKRHETAARGRNGERFRGLPIQADRRRRFRLLESLEDRRFLAADGITPLPPDVDLMGFGAVYGQKWDDQNGDGSRGVNEPGLPGVTIYADVNRNGQWDADEPSAVTQRDNPDTRIDETGRFELLNVPAGRQWIGEIVPDGYVQTYPAGNVPGLPPLVDPAEDPFADVNPPALSLRLEPGEVQRVEVSITILPFCIRPIPLDVVSSDPSVHVENLSGHQLNGCGGDVSQFTLAISTERPNIPFKLIFVDVESGAEYGAIPVNDDGQVGRPGFHQVLVPAGGRVAGLEFGNHRLQSAGVSGRKWLDRNGDGLRNGNEPGLGGVTIYADLNRNGQPDRSEPRTVTSFDDPVTDFDEGGLYVLSGLAAGDYLIREVVPANYVQTFPGIGGEVVQSTTATLNRGIALDLDITDVQVSLSDAAIPNPASAEIELTVLWPDSCGQLKQDGLAATVIQDQIVIALQGHQVGEFCADVLTTRSLSVKVDGLTVGTHDVVAVLQEALPDGTELATLTAVAQISVGQPGAHSVSLGENQHVEGIDFGNQSTLRPGSISGTKWLDENGDARRDRGEAGLGGVTIYVDLNSNGTWESAEPHAITLEDDPNTAVNEAGRYTIRGIEPGRYVVREVVPAGYQQTYPVGPWLEHPLIDPIFWPGPGNSGHFVQVDSGAHLTGLDFGNQQIAPAAIAGVKWLDSNGNGVRERGEPGLASVVIYADLNGNRAWDQDEPHATTRGDDAATADNEAGSYRIEGLLPGAYTIREVVPDGYRQTYPANRGIEVFPPAVPLDLIDLPWWREPDSHFIFVGSGQTVSGVDFGNQELGVLGTVSGRVWNDLNGDGQQTSEEPGLGGVVVYADVNRNGLLDRGEPRTRTQWDISATPLNDTGRYELPGLEAGDYLIRQIVPFGFEQTYPAGGVDGLQQETIDLAPGRALSLSLLNVAGSVFDGIPGGELTFEVVWPDGCGQVLADQARAELEGDTIVVDIFGEQQGEACTLALVSQTVTVSMPEPPGPVYTIRATLWESDRAGDPPMESMLLHAVVGGQRSPGQLVTIAGPGEVVDVNFGNRLSDELPKPGERRPGDLDGDGDLDQEDIALLASSLHSGDAANQADLTGDGVTDEIDMVYLVEGLMQSQFGDANLDGRFNSADLVLVFQAGEYEDGLAGNSHWEEGDWNGDGDFDTADLVFAFQHGAYEDGIAAAVDAVLAQPRTRR